MDDEPFNIITLKLYFQQIFKDQPIDEAYNGKEALQKVEEKCKFIYQSLALMQVSKEGLQFNIDGYQHANAQWIRNHSKNYLVLPVSQAGPPNNHRKFK